MGISQNSIMQDEGIAELQESNRRYLLGRDRSRRPDARLEHGVEMRVLRP
jgi:hypothetical protein